VGIPTVGALGEETCPPYDDYPIVIKKCKLLLRENERCPYSDSFYQRQYHPVYIEYDIFDNQNYALEYLIF